MLLLEVYKYQVPHISYSFWWCKLFSWIHFSGDLVDLTVFFNWHFPDEQWRWVLSYVLISHLHTSVCTNLFSIFKNWLGCYFITEMQELFILSGYKSFVIICERVFSSHLCPIFSIVSFEEQKILTFLKLNLSICNGNFCFSQIH